MHFHKLTENKIKCNKHFSELVESYNAHVNNIRDFRNDCTKSKPAVSKNLKGIKLYNILLAVKLMQLWIVSHLITLLDSKNNN